MKKVRGQQKADIGNAAYIGHELCLYIYIFYLKVKT